MKLLEYHPRFAADFALVDVGIGQVHAGNQQGAGGDRFQLVDTTQQRRFT